MSNSIRKQIQELTCLNTPVSEDECEPFSVSSSFQLDKDKRSKDCDGSPIAFPRGSLQLTVNPELSSSDSTYHGVKINRVEAKMDVLNLGELVMRPDIFSEVGNVDLKYQDTESDYHDEEEMLSNDNMASYKRDNLCFDHENESFESSSIGDKNENLHDAQNCELVRGIAARNQLGFSDRLFELRIKLQKPLQSSRRYPQCENIELFQSLSSEFMHEQREVRMLATTVFEKLVGLHSLLNETLKCNSVQSSTHQGSLGETDMEAESMSNDQSGDFGKEVKDSVCFEKNNSSRLETVQHISQLQHTNGDFEMEAANLHYDLSKSVYPIIDKWDEKIRLASGKEIKKQFSYFDRSTLSQVKKVMLDKKRLIRRTKLKRSVYRILGNRQNEVSLYTNGEDTADLHLRTLDDEVFDDDDFYHQLLKEFIARSRGPCNDPSIRSSLNLETLKRKSKETKERNATKGRKIRYNLHSKLLNFMTPISLVTIRDQSRSDVFKSIFGGKST